MQTSNCAPSKHLWTPLHTKLQVSWITSARSSSHFDLACTLKGMATTPHVIMPKSCRLWLEANLTSASLSTSRVYCKSIWNLSHSRNACLLALAITFYSLWRNWAKGLFKTCTFIVVWSWTLGPCSQVDGRSGLPNSMVTLWRICKCCTKLYSTI
jgi:hypothetical protein